MEISFIENLALYLFIVTVLERFYELYVSHKNRAWSMSQGGIEFGASHYKWMVGLHVCLVIAVPSEHYLIGSDLPPQIRVFALIGVIICQALRWWIITTLGKQWNTRVIIVPGMNRITTGPYRFLNHPNYVVVVTEVLVLPLIYGSWMTSILFSILNGLLLRHRIQIENAALKQLKSNG
jgi:methyltransferase